jgi:hypothetical protein
MNQVLCFAVLAGIIGVLYYKILKNERNEDWEDAYRPLEMEPLDPMPVGNPGWQRNRISQYYQSETE